MLRALQGLLAGIYDVPQTYDVSDFVVTDRSRLPAPFRASAADEVVLVGERGQTLWLSLFVEQGVLERLAAADPLERLHEGNLADYWTALEGVSHFMCIAWHAAHERPVTLAELELQAEIDKYVSSVWLLQGREPAPFPGELLHALLFRRFAVDPQLSAGRTELYERANAYASRFCRRIAATLKRTTGEARAAAIAELRRFYRLCNGEKFRHIERFA